MRSTGIEGSSSTTNESVSIAAADILHSSDVDAGPRAPCFDTRMGNCKELRLKVCRPCMGEPSPMAVSKPGTRVGSTPEIHTLFLLAEALSSGKPLATPCLSLETTSGTAAVERGTEMRSSIDEGIHHSIAPGNKSSLGRNCMMYRCSSEEELKRWQLMTSWAA